MTKPIPPSLGIVVIYRHRCQICFWKYSLHMFPLPSKYTNWSIPPLLYTNQDFYGVIDISTHTPPLPYKTLLNLNISTHTPLAGRDEKRGTAEYQRWNFNSHAPRGAWLCTKKYRKTAILHFNSHAPRGAWQNDLHISLTYNEISTHTPLAGRDLVDFLVVTITQISTHTPLAGRDRGVVLCFLLHSSFQLTRPSRGVTGLRWLETCPDVTFQLTRPSRGVTLRCSV